MKSGYGSYLGSLTFGRRRPAIGLESAEACCVHLRGGARKRRTFDRGVNRDHREGYRFARSRLMMSSEVITPVNFLLSSTTGKVSRLYLSNSSATSFSFTPAWV